MPKSHPGAANGRAKITAHDVADIRSSRDTQAALAKRYGVDVTTICDIRRRVTWGHVHAHVFPPIDRTARWKPVVGYEDRYEVSSDGELRSLRVDGWFPRPTVRQRITRYGYREVRLCVNNAQHIKKVHRLVMEAFVGPVQSGLEVNHKNGRKSDNRLQNLEYVTRLENRRHAVGLGLTPLGERCGNVKLTSAIVMSIRSDPRPARVIAKDYGVCKATVDRVRQKRSWAHLHDVPLST